MQSNALAQGKNANSLVLTKAGAMAEQLSITLLANCEVNAIHRDKNSWIARQAVKSLA
ncbi:MAG: hypothetical protein R8K48_05765 [Gallionella sp.]